MSTTSLFRLSTLALTLGSFAIGCLGETEGGTAAATGGKKGTGKSGGASSVGGKSSVSAGGTSATTSSGTAVSVGGATAAGGATSKGGATGAGGTSVVITGPAGMRAACAAPSGYRNLFVEILGKTQADVDAKVSKGVQQLFHGTSDQTIYYEMGTDQAQIKDIANNDVRSEGQSYGMFVAVTMGMKTEFDKLWKYAASCMRQSNGLFSWQMNPGACSAKSTGVAPDGDEYFAMALMLASRRWGNSTGIDYASEAKKGLAAMANTNSGVFHASPAVVTFGPYQNFSDPSYVLPLFYSEWACFDTANATYWNSATSYGRTFFQKTVNATTGLAPYQANWDGSPYNGSNFNSDSWRVPMNIMMDYNLNGADPWQTTYAKTMGAFWLKEGLSNYGNGYTLSGSKTATGHGAGMVGVNAMLAFALPVADGKQFLQAAWDVAIPTGQYRYYDGCLYMMSMAHLSGKFNLFY